MISILFSYVIYRNVLKMIQSERALFLAVIESIYNHYFKETVILNDARASLEFLFYCTIRPNVVSKTGVKTSCLPSKRI